MNVELEVTELWSGYGKLPVLQGLSMNLEPGGAVAVFGHNGAGKSTLLKTLFGITPVWQGSVRLGGRDITHAPTWERIRAGLALIPQGGGVFRDLTVEENLRASLYALDGGSPDRARGAYKLVPGLADLRTRKAGLLSGGERRLLAIAMAVVRRPRVLLIDEASIGLSPARTEATFRLLQSLREEQGVSLLIAEQNVLAALRWLERAFIIKVGSVAWEGTCAQLSADGEVSVARLL